VPEPGAALVGPAAPVALSGVKETWASWPSGRRTTWPSVAWGNSARPSGAPGDCTAEGRAAAGAGSAMERDGVAVVAVAGGKE
jgi:hypothetical protein